MWYNRPVPTLQMDIMDELEDNFVDDADIDVLCQR